MAGLRGKRDQNIIQIYETEVEVLQRRVDESLKDLRCVVQSKSQPNELKIPKGVPIAVFGNVEKIRQFAIECAKS